MDISGCCVAQERRVRRTRAAALTLEREADLMLVANDSQYAHARRSKRHVSAFMRTAGDAARARVYDNQRYSLRAQPLHERHQGGTSYRGRRPSARARLASFCLEHPSSAWVAAASRDGGARACEPGCHDGHLRTPLIGLATPGSRAYGRLSRSARGASWGRRPGVSVSACVRARLSIGCIPKG